LANIPIVVRDPDQFLATCAQQLVSLQDQTERTVSAIQEQLQTADALPSTKVRGLAMIDAVRGQSADVRKVLSPLMREHRAVPIGSQTFSVPALLTYIHYAYRDWGWPAEPEGENERLLAAAHCVLKGKSVGKMLVLGAGACRLAYDLHRSFPHSETVVLDLDPFLFATAQTVIRGGSLTMREANMEVHQLDGVVKEWVLRAPHEAIEENFYFLFADGLEPPFVAESFDTVITPWFIDIVPTDLRNLVAHIHRLLKPTGRWINIGPLHYRPEVPIVRRFALDELFDLAHRAGFHIDASRTESMPYLVSKLNGRGKVEWVLTFSASKLGISPPAKSTPDVPDGPPAWLLFPHIPIPIFPGRSAHASDDPAEQIVAAAIDGHNTIDDIAAVLASHAGETGLTMDQMREVVRRCLVAVHPELRSGI
jgi:SAM-dependent methyltransferase